MCGKRLKKSCFLFLLLAFFSLSGMCYADVVLTDEEAQEMLSEIEESKKELNQLKAQLNDVKTTYSEQKTSYETQLNEAERKNKRLKTATTVTGTSAGIFMVLMIVFIII